MNLSEQQIKVVESINGGHNVFVTGHAGTGKSYLLKFLKNSVKGLHITASTGIAAVGISGQTIHSWAGIGIGSVPVDKIKFTPATRNRVYNAKILAIDEISMISAETFDMINSALKKLKCCNKPFGGIQMILFGDFFQLPPVHGEFAFQSTSWEELSLKNCILTETFRQNDPIFIEVLNKVRTSNIDESVIETLTGRVGLKNELTPTILVSHNGQADSINQSELSKIKEPTRIFKASYTSIDEYKLNFLKTNCLAYDILHLRVGSKVMMLRNTYAEYGIINGSVGTVKRFDEYPVVEFKNDIGTLELPIEPETWTLEKYNDATQKVVTEASITQIPLIFAWALTIHKSHGMSLSMARINLSKVFTFGQGYVALSRVRTLEGLYIDEIDFSKFRANETVVKFYEKLLE